MRKLLFVAMAAMAFATSQADDVQTVTIDGTAVNKQVSAIAFDGDNLTLTYTDGTKSETIDMSTVIITFDTSTALKELENESGQVKFFNLSGQQLQGAPAQGAYLIKKGNKTVKVVRQ